MLTASEQARYARSVIESISASLRADQLVRLVEVGRRLLDEQDEAARREDRTDLHYVENDID